MKKIIFLVSATLFLAACGSESEPEAPAEPETAQEATTERESRREVRRSEDTPDEPATDPSRDPAKNIPRFSGEAEEDGYGLTMIVDGSSPEAFQESLEMIARDSTDQQYRQLDSALRYLKMYSPAGWSGNAALYQSLDGMSGEEIIEKAAERRRSRSQ